MANAAGLVQESIWRDADWRDLSRGAQALYVQLLSQKELDCAGILPLQVNKWAKGCNTLTADEVWTDLAELQEKRFVFYDLDTDEAFVRTHIRNSNVLKVPNMLKSARRSALLVGSDVIRPILASELRATGNAECVAVADQIDPSGTVSEPFPEGSGKGSKSKGFETLSEGSGTGMGTGTGVTLVGTSVGEAPPSEFCPEHPQGTASKCFACGQARRSYPERKARWNAEQKAAANADRESAIKACTLCDEFGDITYDDAVRKCDHQAADRA